MKMGMRLATALVLMLLWASAGAAGAGKPDRLDRMETPPSGWQGHIFRPDYSFPQAGKASPVPWAAISFRKEPGRYLQSILDYVLEGQDLEHWDLASNRSRRWYHMPWMGPGASGREFIHGLTRARDFSKGELGPNQVTCEQNWALSFFNENGGMVLGRIWKPVRLGLGGPDLGVLPFLSGTAMVKLVFTTATAADDPTLAGAPELQANIHAGGRGDTCPSAIDANGTAARREPQMLRLVQVDLAVREDRASYKTGWVFGSFRYDGSMTGSDPWQRLRPMGLMWGNDPQLSDAAFEAGGKSRQTIMLDTSRTYGRSGRMNGIVDEPSSACSSCHMAAQWPTLAPMVPQGDWKTASCWFRNLDARYPFGFSPGAYHSCGDTAALKQTRSLDFSLQLAIALRNWSLDRTRTQAKARTSIGKLQRAGKDHLLVNGLETLSLRR